MGFCAVCKEVYCSLNHIDSRGNMTLPALPALPSGTEGKSFFANILDGQLGLGNKISL